MSINCSYDLEKGEFYIPYTDYIPLDACKELHCQYWRALAEYQGEKLKLKIVSKITGGRILIRHCCFACEYAYRIAMSNHKPECKNCPIVKWRVKDDDDLGITCEYPKNDNFQYALYRTACITNNYKARRKYALQVAEMEWEDLHHDDV